MPTRNGIRNVVVFVKVRPSNRDLRSWSVFHRVPALRARSQGDFPVRSLPFKLALAFRRARREARRSRARVGRRARRTMRGERHTLMVESSLAESRSS